MRTSWYFVIVGALAACSGETIDAGTNDSGAGGASASGSSGSSSGASSGATTEVFKGSIEGFMFPSGSSTVVMNLAFGTNGAVTGTVFFGDGPALAPPTDPNVGYPPGLGLADQTSPEDFAYTVLQGMDVSSRVTLQVETNELYKKWCQLQMSYPWYENMDGTEVLVEYGCTPGNGTWGGSGDSCHASQGTTLIPVDCGTLTLCAMDHVCTCTATSCTVPLSAGNVRFDMELTGDALNGSVTGLSDRDQSDPTQVYNVHLTRSP
jgi:hypothetical protein